MNSQLVSKTLFLGLPLASIPAMAQQEVQKPNILVILADDMAMTELSCYGGQNLTTPHIDQLASEGMRMTHNFASCAMSVPIRASLYTGLYPVRNGSYRNHKATFSNVKSVTHYLSDLGYRVGRTGKDHPVNQPQVYAFEKIPGFTVGCTDSHPAPATANGISEFMSRNDDQPFCLFVCSINSHIPWDAGDASEFDPSKIILPPNCVDNTKTRNEFCNYLAEIRLLDNEVGMVINALKATGKADNTLVIFLSEQGPQMPFGKWTCYRYGQASALIARYPGKIAVGSVCDALIQYEDILPTLIEFAGGDPIPTLDGISQLDVLFGKAEGPRKWIYGLHNNVPEGPAYPIRSIQDSRYKFIWNLMPEVDYYEKHMMAYNNNPNNHNVWTSWMETSLTDSRAKWLTDRFVRRPAFEFYDLQEDPWELNNLAEDPQYQQRMALMKEELERWMEQQGDQGAILDTDNADNPALKTPEPISSFDELNVKLRNDLSGNYYLDADIVIPQGTEWIPIGAANATDGDPQRFKGILDGRGHSISGLTIQSPCAFKGLFGRLEYAVVKNLELIDVNINGLAPTGGVAGSMFGSSRIEHVAVTGHIQSVSEAGGIAGRVARDPTHTDYNRITDCYVNASIKATKMSTDLNAPSCAGGIVGFMHSNTPSVARLTIERTYFAGSVATAQNSHRAGCAAGIIAFTDLNPNIRLNEVLVLADDISGATPNYFYSRRLAAAPNNVIEHMSNLYVCDDISLQYFSDKGVGGDVPDSVYTLLPRQTFGTEAFYKEHLTWDFENVWCIGANGYPVFRKDQFSAICPQACAGSTHHDFSFYDLHGRKVVSSSDTQLKRGLYIQRSAHDNLAGEKFFVR